MMPTINHSNRRGIVAVKVAVLLVPMMGMLALAIDYGYLVKVRTDLQRAADAAALAAARDLVPEANGNQNLATARSTIRQYADSNVEAINNFQVLDADMQIGRYDPSTIYTSVSFLGGGDSDTVRVTLRRDARANSPVGLFFAPALGIANSEVTATATAILQRASQLRAGADILPFAVPQQVWNSKKTGDDWDIYSDGKIYDPHGNLIPGNWGTVDIGSTTNSTSDISNQIVNGLRQQDLNALQAQHRITNNAYIDGTQPISVQGDTGLSSGMKDAVQAIHGQIRYIPIFDTVSGEGNGAEYHVVRWGAVRVINSHWAGSKDTFIRVEKTYKYDVDLRPNGRLNNLAGSIEGVFTMPVLVE